MNAFPRITPLVLKRRVTAFDNPNYLFDLKYDAFRALLEIDASGARLVSRNRSRFKHLDTLAAAHHGRGARSLGHCRQAKKRSLPAWRKLVQDQEHRL
jgi:ATP-dependent DNA ligase